MFNRMGRNATTGLAALNFPVVEAYRRTVAVPAAATFPVLVSASVAKALDRAPATSELTDAMTVADIAILAGAICTVWADGDVLVLPAESVALAMM
jgi:hypothetical protein